MTTRSRLVFKLVVPTGSGSATTTRYVTTRGFRTLSTDTPASTYIEERVAKAGGFSRSLFSGSAMGGLIKPNYGVLTLNNEDGGLDTIATYAGGGGTVTCWWGEDGAAFPAGYTQVYVATIASVLVDFETVVIRQQDRFEQLNRPVVTATFAGTGSIEGTDTAARKKQIVFGSPGMIPLILIDKVNQVYCVQVNATDRATVAGLAEFGLVFEGGVPITRAAPYAFKEHLFLASQAPDPGEFRIWSGYQGLTIGSITIASESAAAQYTKGPIYVRLGGIPVGELRFGARGLLQNVSSTPAREWRFSDLCNRAGLNDVSSSTMATMQNGREDFTAGNRLIDGEQTYAQVMSDRCQAVLGAAGFNRLNEFFCVSLTDPEDGDDTSAYSFTVDNSADFRRLPVPGMERPVWQVNIKSGRAWPCTVFSGASAEMQDLLTREGHYIAFRGYSSTTRRRYPNALSIDLEIEGHDFPDSSDQRTFVDRFGKLFGTRRDLMTLRCMQFDATTLALELHDKATLTLDRLGYDAGVVMRIVGIELDLDAMVIKFSLWGNNTDWDGWSLTGGAFPADAGEPGGSWGDEDPPPDVVTETNVTLGINEQMGAFTGLIYGGPVVIPVPADSASNNAAMGEFTGVIRGEIAGDADWASVVLLLHCNGTDGSTTIDDSSSFARTGTGNSTIALSTTRGAFGSSSSLKVTRQDPGGIAFGAHADFARTNNQPWTMECMVYVVTSENFTNAPVLMYWLDNNSVADTVSVYGTAPKIDISTSGTGEPAPTTISKNVWVHVAVTFDGTNENLWIDGVSAGSFARSIGASATATLYIGGFTGSGAADTTEVYIDEVRVTKGVARYTATFTPPSSEFQEG